MTLEVDITDEAKTKLDEAAKMRGFELPQFVSHLLERYATRLHRSFDGQTIDQVLTPFRKQVEESGMTDEEFDAFFEEMRDEVWVEQQNRNA